MSFLYFTPPSRQFFVVAENPANVRSVTHFFGQEPGNDGIQMNFSSQEIPRLGEIDKIYKIMLHKLADYFD